MPDALTNAAYWNSPFNPQQQTAPQPRYSPFVTKSLPTAGVYAPDSTVSLAAAASMTDGERMASLYRQSDRAFEYTNPDDGSEVTIAPDFAAARTQDGLSLFYDRTTGAFILENGARAIAARVDGTIRETEYGNTVTSQQDGSIVAQSKNGQQQSFASDTFDPQRDLVQAGYLSPAGAAEFAQACKEKSLGNLPELTRAFKPSTANALNTAQWLDAQGKPAPTA